MREIKYRAWHKERKKMYHVAKVDLWGDPDQATCDLVSEDDEQLFDIYLHEVKLMQDTGLKDKNNKEIYEGYILHWKDHSELSDGTLECNVRVFWDDEHLRWSVETIEYHKIIERLYDYSDIREIEIIGNIFENPELLK